MTLPCRGMAYERVTIMSPVYLRECADRSMVMSKRLGARFFFVLEDVLRV